MIGIVAAFAEAFSLFFWNFFFVFIGNLLGI